MTTTPYRNTYGSHEVNGLTNGPQYHEAHADAPTVDWSEPGLRITRLRLVSDPGFPLWDVSYCYGVLKDGTKVEVQLPFSQLPKKGTAQAIIQYAKAEKLYAKGIGILDCISTLN